MTFNIYSILSDEILSIQADFQTIKDVVYGLCHEKYFKEDFSSSEKEFLDKIDEIKHKKVFKDLFY